MRSHPLYTYLFFGKIEKNRKTIHHIFFEITFILCKMLDGKRSQLCFVLLLSMKIVGSQVNFYYTNEINDHSNDLQYNCLHLINYGFGMPYSILWYCMNEFSTKSNTNITYKGEQWTFAQLQY